VKTLVDEVSLGSQEQAGGIEQIGKAILQMQQVTQKTAANAEEGAAAAEELTAQAETLKDILDSLIGLVGSAGSANGRSGGTVAHRRGASSGKRKQSAASSWEGKPAAGLSALRTAVERRHAWVPAHSQNLRQAFPLEEEFKEF
jgi:hypothetical protein